MPFYLQPNQHTEEPLQIEKSFSPSAHQIGKRGETRDLLSIQSYLRQGASRRTEPASSRVLRRTGEHACPASRRAGCRAAWPVALLLVGWRGRAQAAGGTAGTIIDGSPRESGRPPHHGTNWQPQHTRRRRGQGECHPGPGDNRSETGGGGSGNWPPEADECGGRRV